MPAHYFLNLAACACCAVAEEMYSKFVIEFATGNVALQRGNVALRDAVQIGQGVHKKYRVCGCQLQVDHKQNCVGGRGYSVFTGQKSCRASARDKDVTPQEKGGQGSNCDERGRPH